MAVQYRVVDMRADAADALDILIEGVNSPEEACRQALGIEAVRSGHGSALVAEVHFEMLGRPPTLVRLYRKPKWAV